MTFGSAVRPGFGAAAAGLVAVDLLVRALAGGTYPGATAILVTACGVALLPFLPGELARPSIRLALVPALGIGSFMLVLTTVALVGIELTELSIRLAVAAIVGVSWLGAVFLERRQVERMPRSWSPRREVAVLAVLLAIGGFALASSYDILDPFPPPGTDWAYYLLYAEEVESQGALLIDNPYAVGDARGMGHYPGLGALYGSARILDGASSDGLAQGLALLSALTTLSVFAAVGGLWGATAGLLAAGAYSVSPIRLEPMYWHGLATVLALVFIPLVVLGLGLIFRGRRRDLRAVGLLAFALACVAVAHSLSAVVVAVMVAVVLVAELVRGLVSLRTPPRRDAARAWWRTGVTRPVLAAVALASVLGAGVIVHLRLHAGDLGAPVSYRFYDPDWFDARTLDFYYSTQLLLLVAASLVVVLVSRLRRSDPALAALAALVVAAAVVSQLWRVEVPFEYRRVVYYAAIALVALVGVASFGLARRRLWAWSAVCVVAFVLVAQESIGLRLPERLLRGDGETRSAELDALARFGEQLDRDDPTRAAILVADRCLSMRVVYVLRRPTLIEAEEWQAGFESLVPIARAAAAVVAGGAEGRRLAAEYDVRYVLVDPRCSPAAEAAIGGDAVFTSEELVVVEL